MNLVKPQTIAGVMELLPEKQIQFNYVLNTIERCFKQYGFLPIDTPLIEKDDILFAKGGGETEKQIFKIQSESKDMSLRYDLTVPLARYTAEHFQDLSFPFKRYQIGKVYRGERNQKGRYKEFYQCDIDIIGNGSLSIFNDAQLPAVIYEIFSQLNLKDVLFQINNRKLLNGYFKYLDIKDSEVLLRTIDKMKKIGMSKTEELLFSDIKDSEKVSKIIEFISSDELNEQKIKNLEKDDFNNIYSEGIQELKNVYEYMKLFNIPDENIKIDLSITRGLDYYTSTVYETFIKGYESIGSVSSGGRYENLTENFSKQKLPGVGMSIGLTRLFYQLDNLGLTKDYNAGRIDYLVIPMHKQFNEKALEVYNSLKNYKSCDIFLEDCKIKKKFNYADKINVKECIIIGEEEVLNGKVTVKDMKTGEQKLIELSCLI